MVITYWKPTKPPCCVAWRAIRSLVALNCRRLLGLEISYNYHNYSDTQNYFQIEGTAQDNNFSEREKKSNSNEHQGRLFMTEGRFRCADRDRPPLTVNFMFSTPHD